jgi:cardiolipin synthase
MVVDVDWATECSTNFDNRSFALNEELNLTVYDSGIARRLEEAFEQDLKYSRKISYEEWHSRGIGERIYEIFAFPVKEYL